MIKIFVGLVAAAFFGAYTLQGVSPASAQDAGAGVTANVPAADAQTTAIVKAADAFLAALRG